MISIRRVTDADFPAVDEIMAELNLGHPSISKEDFWVALDGGGILGVANILDCGECHYVSAVGVRRKYQKRGVARALLDEILPRLKKDAYLYTKIPDFFRRFGFAETKAPETIPPREIYSCGKCCDESICLCMMRPK